MDREISEIEKKRRRIRFATRVAVPALVIVLGFVFLPRLFVEVVHRSEIKTGTVDRGTIDITISATGKAVPLVEEVVVSPISSRILEVYKVQGDRVDEGEPLLRLDLASVETEYRKKLDEREVRRSKMVQERIEAEKTLSEMEMDIQIKEMGLGQLQTALQSERHLDSIGAGTGEKVRAADLRYREALLTLEHARRKLDDQRRSTAAGQRVGELEFSIFEKEFDESVRIMNDARIPSPRRAVLTFINNQTGATVGAGERLAVVSDLTAFKIEAEASDVQRDLIGVGSVATIEVGDHRILGRVASVDPSAEAGAVKFTVVPDDAGYPALRRDLRVRVYVSYGMADDVLRLPAGDYFTSGKGTYDMWVMNGATAAKRTVRLGDSNYEYVEVVSGLSEGEQVIISSMDDRYGYSESIKIK